MSHTVKESKAEIIGEEIGAIILAAFWLFLVGGWLFFIVNYLF